VDGGERAVPAEKAGLSPILARLLVSGAAGRDAPAYADAVRTLGGEVKARATRTALDLEVSGLSSRLGATLGLFADAALRPNLSAADFEREAALARARVDARADEPRAVAAVAAAAALHGRDDVRGRPVDGYGRTVAAITHEDVRRLAPRLLDPRGAVLVFAGDFELPALRAALEQRFGGWRPQGERLPAPPPAGAGKAGPAGRIVLVDRPGAPQTVIHAVRPAARPDDAGRAVRDAVNVALGGSFTSRLNQNLREKHGYTYGARSAFVEEGPETTFVASASVQTEVTGPALVELRRELDGLAGGLPEPEVVKARETARHRLVEEVQTTRGLAGALAEAVLAGRPADALRREAAAFAAVDATSAGAVARSGAFGFAGLTVVLVGDRKAILPQLEKAGFPAPTYADVEGSPIVKGAAPAAAR
jgi:predicted Zn-dependent peptidase